MDTIIIVKNACLNTGKSTKKHHKELHIHNQKDANNYIGILLIDFTKPKRDKNILLNITQKTKRNKETTKGHMYLIDEIQMDYLDSRQL